MLEQVQSPSVDEQLSGLQLLATLADNTTHVMAIMETNVIRIVGPLLTTPNQPSLCLAALGALRNLSTCGVEVCDVLYEEDIMTPLLALLNEYRGEWQPLPVDTKATKVIDNRAEIFLSAIHLLSNICESCSGALEGFYNCQLLTPIMRCLDYTVYGLEISVAVAQLLLIVSEDNSSMWQTFHEMEDRLVALMSLQVDDQNFGTILLRTLATGIVSNVPALAQQHMAQVMLGLDRPFQENHRTLLNSLSSDIPLVEKSQRFETEIRNDDPDDLDMETEELHATQKAREAEAVAEVEKQVKNVGYLLEAQRVAAEILANICSSEDAATADDWDEMSADEDEDGVQDYDDEEAEEKMGDGDQVQADKLPVEMLEAIKSLQLVEKLWQRAQPIAENVQEILVRCERNLAKKLKLLRVSCILCLHNLCNVMTLEDLGGAESIYQVWMQVGREVYQGAAKGDAHILEASTALMRATMEHLKKSPELFAGMTEADLEMILSGVRQCSEPEIRANGLRVLGQLGCLLQAPLVKVIMQFLLESSAQEEEDAWTISEAMDALMDMFADNDWPEIAAQLSLGQKIRQLEKVLKTKLRQQKRELGERYAAVETVRTNMVRFGKYVEKEVLKAKR